MQKRHSSKIETISDSSDITMITEDGVIAEMIIEVDGDSDSEYTGSFSPEVEECSKVMSPSVSTINQEFGVCSPDDQNPCSNGDVKLLKNHEYSPRKDELLKNCSTGDTFGSNEKQFSNLALDDGDVRDFKKEKIDNHGMLPSNCNPEGDLLSIRPDSSQNPDDNLHIVKDGNIGMLNMSLDCKPENHFSSTSVKELAVERVEKKPIKRRRKRRSTMFTKKPKLNKNLSLKPPSKIEKEAIDDSSEIGVDTLQPLSNKIVLNGSAGDNESKGICIGPIDCPNESTSANAAVDHESSEEGKTLGDILHIKERVNSAAQYSLKLIHQILYDQIIPKNLDTLKEEILRFGGFPFSEASQESNSRVTLIKSLPDFALQEVCCILSLKDGAKNEMISNIFSFLSTFKASDENSTDNLQLVSLEKLSDDLVEYRSSKIDKSKKTAVKTGCSDLPENAAESSSSNTRVLRSAKKQTTLFQIDVKPSGSKRREGKTRSKGKQSFRSNSNESAVKTEEEILPTLVTSGIRADDSSSSSSSTSTSSESDDGDSSGGNKRKMLGQLPEVRKNISKCSLSEIQRLHAFIFNKLDRPEVLKKNVLQFEGFGFRRQSSKWLRKEFVLSLMAPIKLKEMADLLHLPCFYNKQRMMIPTIMKFLSSPKESLLKSYVHDPKPVLTKPAVCSSPKPIKQDAPTSCIINIAQSKKKVKKFPHPVAEKWKFRKNPQADENNLREMKQLLSNIRRKQALKKSGYSIRSVSMPDDSIADNTKKKLDSIPNVQFMVITSNYEDLQDLHQLLYLRPASKARIRRNILDFDGFRFEQESGDYKIRIGLLNKMGYEVAKRIAFFLGLATLVTTLPHEDLNELIMHFLMCPSSIQIKTITHFPENFFTNLPRQSFPMSVSISDQDSAQATGLTTDGSNTGSNDCIKSEADVLEEEIDKDSERIFTSKTHPRACAKRNGSIENSVQPKGIKKLKTSVKGKRNMRKKVTRIAQRKKIRKVVNIKTNLPEVNTEEGESVWNMERQVPMETENELKDIGDQSDTADAFSPELTVNSQIESLGDEDNYMSPIAAVEAVYNTVVSDEEEVLNSNFMKESNCDDDNKLNIKSTEPCSGDETVCNNPKLSPISDEKQLETVSPNAANTSLTFLSPLNEKVSTSHEGVKIRTILLPPPGNQPNAAQKMLSGSNSKSALSPRYFPISSMLPLPQPTSLLKQSSPVLQNPQINTSSKQKLFVIKSPPSTPLSVISNQLLSTCKNQAVALPTPQLTSSPKQTVTLSSSQVNSSQTQTVTLSSSQLNSSQNQTVTFSSPQFNSSKRYVLVQGSKAFQSVCDNQGRNILPTQSNQPGKSSPNLVILNDKLSLLQPRSSGMSVNPSSLKAPATLPSKVVTKVRVSQPCVPKGKLPLSRISNVSSTQPNETNNIPQNTTILQNTLQTLVRQGVVGKTIQLEDLQKCVQQYNRISSNKSSMKQVQIFKLPKPSPSTLSNSIKNGHIVVMSVKNSNQSNLGLRAVSTTAAMGSSSGSSNVQIRPYPLNSSEIKINSGALQRTACLPNPNKLDSSGVKIPHVQNSQPLSHPVKLTAREEYVLPCDISHMSENHKEEASELHNENSSKQTQQGGIAFEPCNSTSPKDSETSESPSVVLRHRTDSCSDSDYDEEPLSHLVGHPSDETLFNNVHELIINSSLDNITMRNVLQQVYDLYPQFDLKYRKSFLKDTVKKIVCSITTGHWPYG